MVHCWALSFHKWSRLVLYAPYAEPGRKLQIQKKYKPFSNHQLTSSLQFVLSKSVPFSEMTVPFCGQLFRFVRFHQEQNELHLGIVKMYSMD